MARRATPPVTAEPELVGLAPIARHDARVLILGSMPGAASLGAGRYYAHPGNAFWPLIALATDSILPASYAERCRLLTERLVALWDVVHRCRRRGSLDAAIDASSVVANDVAGLLRAHPAIGTIFFNGGAAQVLFDRHLRHAVEAVRPGIRCIRLPSSSPANASWSMSRKQEAWEAVRVALASPPAHETK